MTRGLKLVLIVPLIVAGVALFAFIGGQIVMQLWNWLLPPLFGWRTITFWQALGLLALCRILFGGRGMMGSGRSRFRRRMEERCDELPPDKREKLRRIMRARWGFGPLPDDAEQAGKAE